MCHGLLEDARFSAQLLRFDLDLAQQASSKSCPHCSARLHRADYPRKPRGVPAAVEKDFAVRFSLCCAGDACRKRLTPPSVRFLDRRVYPALVVVLVTALAHGLSSGRCGRLKAELGVDRRTLERWRKWWQEELPPTEPWREGRGQFAGELDTSELPCSLLAHFTGDERARVFGALRLLIGTSQSVAMRQRYAMAV